jgi:acyl-CoA thioester hydrolase
MSEAVTSRVPMRVRFCETDQMGIVHHSNYVLYFEIARGEWLRRRGVAYREWAAKGIQMAMVDVEVHYKQPALYDDELVVETVLTQITAATVRFEYRVLRGDAVLTTGMTRLACVGADRTVRRLPEEVKRVLASAEAPV